MGFQDEVRALGRLPALNVPEAFITRHPFPGRLPPPALHRADCIFSGQGVW
jgi:GMP synthase PP-ATPase subunit